jgi:hypothetical protein
MTKDPFRVQLSRARGWRMPPNTVKVDRTTPWGNPYDVREFGGDLSLQLFASTACGCWSRSNVQGIDDETLLDLHAAHCAWLRRLGGRPLERARRELRGRNLACWCPLPALGEDDECHAAILLRVANR